jgi:hypothetical protein
MYADECSALALVNHLNKKTRPRETYICLHVLGLYSRVQLTILNGGYTNSVCIPDPDPACHFDADPDPTFHFDADPDEDLYFQKKAQNLEKLLK